MNESGTTAAPRWFTEPNNKWRRLFVTGTEVIYYLGGYLVKGLKGLASCQVMKQSKLFVHRNKILTR